MLASGTDTRYWDEVAKVPYCYSPTAHGGHFLSYEDAVSLGFKEGYMYAQGLGGVMIWKITANCNQALLNIISSGR